MTLAGTFDTIEVVIGDTVDDDATIDSDRFEPKFTAVPFFIEFDEPTRLDPERAGLIWEVRAPAGRAIWLRSPVVSIAFHLLPFLAVMLLPMIMTEPPAEIPVQLVFEQPPPPPPPPPKPPPQPAPKPPQLEQPPHGPLSSVDQGVVKPLDLGRTADPVAPPAAGAQQPTPTQTQTTTPATQSPPLPPTKPAVPKAALAAIHPPKPSGAPTAHHAEIPHEAPHSARYAGDAATRDEYLAYLVALTRQHIDLLPMSVVGSRRGETVISVVVYDNGAIGPLGVLRSSGYPDIDQRIQAMVAAVHKFPPLPQWYQGNAVQLELTLKFPEALEQR